VFSIGSFAQSKRPNGLYLGVMASADRTYNYLYNTGIYQPFAGYNDSTDIPRFCYTLGANVCYQTGPYFSVECGIEYGLKSEKTKILKNSAHYYNEGVVPESAERFQLFYETAYLDIPVRINCFILKRTVSPYLGMGFSPSVFLFDKTEGNFYFDNDSTATYKHFTTSTETYKRVNPRLQIATGVDIAIKSQRIRVEIIHRFSLSQVNKGFYAKQYYSIGLNLSYHIRLL
jgi:hypothetical protein